MAAVWELVVAADDRTGALEVAGEIAARIGRPVPMVPFRSAFAHEPAQGGWSLRERGGAGGDGPAFVHGPAVHGEPVNKRDVLVVDLGSRHLDVDEARARAVAVEAISSRRRAHKLDSALRGHWADEVAARLAMAPGDAAVVAALPAAGRLVRGGVVL